MKNNKEDVKVCHSVKMLTGFNEVTSIKDCSVAQSRDEQQVLKLYQKIQYDEIFSGRKGKTDLVQ